MTPFHPTTVYPDQVTIELNLANQNFTTLANIFMNNDPTTLQLKPSVGGNAYANPINLSSQTTDYLLEPGQVGVVSFSSQSLVPLNVAVPQPSSPLNPVMYELDVVGISATSYSAVAFLFFPNNTTYSYQLQDNAILQSATTNNIPTVSSTVVPYNYLTWYPLPPNWAQGPPMFAKATMYYAGSTNFRQILGYTGAQFGISIHNTWWFNNSTSWTSLGSIGFALDSSGAPAPVSGFALVRRLA
jgi:hypothetical protein